MKMKFDNEKNTERIQKLFKQNCERPWEQAMKPIQVSPHSYYIGGSWIGVLLISTNEGLILIDAGMPFQLYTIFEGIRDLGFNPHNIKKVLLSHAHYDHCGAMRAVLEYTGAALYASKEDFAAYSGEDIEALHNRGYFYTGIIPDYYFDDKMPIELGNISIRSVHTPGHTPGTTSFFYDDCDSTGTIYRIGLHGGLGINTLADDGETDARKAYRDSMLMIRKIPVDIAVSLHPVMLDMHEKAARATGQTNTFLDDKEWIRLIDRYLSMLDDIEHQSESIEESKL